MAVTNVEGAVSNLGAYGPFYARPYPRSDYRRTVRVSAAALAEPRAVSRLVARRSWGVCTKASVTRSPNRPADSMRILVTNAVIPSRPPWSFG
jgi:hypothetical protein